MRSTLRVVPELPLLAEELPADDVEFGSTIRPEPLQWVLPGRILQGAICVLEGDPDAGKSTFLSHLAASITSGKPWLDRPACEPANIFWLTSEEALGSVLLPRIADLGGDVDRVIFPKKESNGIRRRYCLPDDCEPLRRIIHKHRVAMLVVDPLVSFLAHDLSLNDQGAVRAALDPLAGVCMATGVGAILVRQLKKDRTGPRMLHGLGSIAVAATARSVLVIDQPDPSEPGRVLRCVKPPAGSQCKPLAYRLDFSSTYPRMVDERPLERVEDDPDGGVADPCERYVREDAREILSTVLKDKPVKVDVIQRIAEQAGIGWRTMQKVKAELRCASIRVGFGPESYLEWGSPGSKKAPPVPPVRSKGVRSMQSKKKGPKKQTKKKKTP